MLYHYYLDIKIKMRHSFLEQTFGTKPEEDLSHKNSNTLMISATVCMFAFCILEIVFYYLYNRMVSQLSLRILCILYGGLRTSIVSFQFHPWVKIVKGKVVSYEPEEDGSCWCGCGSVWYVTVNCPSFS